MYNFLLKINNIFFEIYARKKNSNNMHLTVHSLRLWKNYIRVHLMTWILNNDLSKFFMNKYTQLIFSCWDCNWFAIFYNKIELTIFQNSRFHAKIRFFLLEMHEKFRESFWFPTKNREKCILKIINAQVSVGFLFQLLWKWTKIHWVFNLSAVQKFQNFRNNFAKLSRKIYFLYLIK